MVDGDSPIDFFIKDEDFEDDLRILSSILKLEDNLYDVVKDIKIKANKRPNNKSTKEHFMNFQYGIDLVNILCRYEIEKFGYRLD